MSFKRFDGFYGSAPQKKIDQGVKKCPFCGRDPHWLLEIGTGAATCLCEKCGARLKVRCHNLEYESRAEVVSVGRKYTGEGLLVGSVYSMQELDAASLSITPDTENEEADRQYTISNEDVIIKQSKNTTNDTDNTGSKKLKTLLIAGAALLCVILLAIFITVPLSCSSNEIKLDDDTYAYSQSYGSGLYIGYVKGTFENVSGKSFDVVELEFKLYDHNGTVVGTAFAFCYDVAKGETRQFDAVSYDCTGPVDHYKLTKCITK